MLLILGRSIRPGRAPEPASVLDVAPTFLYLAGFPRSGDHPGRVLSDAADDAFRSTYPPKRIETFGDRAVAKPGSRPSSPDSYELLRSLGYLR
jgi:hypothetical protein